MKNFLNLLALVCFSGHVFAQNVGINIDGSSPDASAILDVKSTDRGLLVPRMSLSDVTSASPVTSPATGLLVYNTNASVTGGNGTGFYYWNGSQWVRLDAANSGDWRLTGNAGTSPATNFLGTTDATDLSIRTNGSERIRVSSSGTVRLNNYTMNNILKTSGGDGTLTVGEVNLASSEVTGILPIANGGTNSSATPTSGGVAYGTGTAYAFTPAGSTGNILLSNGSSAPSWADPNSLFWRVNGNSGRTPSSSNIGTAVNNNFIGTTDANDFVVARNNLEAFRVREVGGSQIASFNSGAGGYIVGSIGSLNTVMTIGGAQNTSGVSNPIVLIMDRNTSNDAPNNIFGGIAFGEPGSANRAGQVRIEGRRSTMAASSGATDLPSDLVFFSTPDGTATARDWMRLSHDGSLVLGENDNQVGYGPGRIRGTWATGTDGSGQNLTIDAGNGTGTGGSGSLIFRTAPPGSTGTTPNTMTERMRITNLGRVGIGTTSPNTLMDVVGGASATETRLLTVRSNFTADNTGSAIAMINSTSTSSNVGAELAAITTNASNGASQLVFRTHGGGGSFGALNERMRLTNEGRLGIGTTGPAERIHIEGNNYTAGFTVSQGLATMEIEVAQNSDLTGPDNAYHTITCPNGYAMVNLAIYSDARLNGGERCNCVKVNDLITTNHTWRGRSGGATTSGSTTNTFATSDDNQDHSCSCNDGEVITGFEVYSSDRLDGNMKVRCTTLKSGYALDNNVTTTINGHTVRGIMATMNVPWNRQRDDQYHISMCSLGTFVTGVVIYASDRLDGELRCYCSGVKVN